jgi:O-acetyl-ADP-ribose deacetylase (regulator of RNase III)
MGVIRYTTGDILQADAEALVNTVNCVGVMGRGIALQFKNRFPLNFKAYKAACDRDEVQPGRMFIVETGMLTPPRYIINFPTKRHWKGKSRMEDVEVGLVALVNELKARKIRSIAIPPLGAGLGGLNWSDVRTRIVAAMVDLPDVEVIVYEPSETPDSKVMARTTSFSGMTPGRAALVVLMDRYLRGLLDPFVSLLEVHKLLYFMQEAGEPLKLQYTKAHYGPYAKNLSHVLKAIEGHLVSGYADGGDAPEKELALVPGAVQDAEQYLANNSISIKRFNRVATLVEGFESPFGLELLSTVHWIAVHENVHDTQQIVANVHAWNSRKKQFSDRQIRLAIDVLQSKGWLVPHAA